MDNATSYLKINIRMQTTMNRRRKNTSMEAHHTILLLFGKESPLWWPLSKHCC